MTGDPWFSTPDMTKVFAVANQVAMFARFEAELAAAQADLGLVPVGAATEIAAACAIAVDDPAALLREGREVGTPIVPLLDLLSGRLDPDTSRWLHRGATTQDVIDTALVLQLRSGLGVLGRAIAGVAGTLAELADAHRHTVMMGRTFLQAAVPTTFGAKVALWLEPLVRLRGEIAAVASMLPLQLGGPVGDMATFEGRGFEVADRVAERLGLVAPTTPWHTDRSPIVAAVGVANGVATAMAKIGTDIALLAQSGVDEIEVRAGSSSSMPGKRNPVDAVAAVAAAEVCHALAAGITGAKAHERERAIGTWHAESAMVPPVFQAAAASVAAIGRCVASIEVDVTRMAASTAGGAADGSLLIDRVLAAHRAGSAP